MEWRVPTGEAEAVARKTTLGTVPLKKKWCRTRKMVFRR